MALEDWSNKKKLAVLASIVAMVVGASWLISQKDLGGKLQGKLEYYDPGAVIDSTGESLVGNVAIKPVKTMYNFLGDSGKVKIKIEKDIVSEADIYLYVKHYNYLDAPSGDPNIESSKIYIPADTNKKIVELEIPRTENAEIGGKYKIFADVTHINKIFDEIEATQSITILWGNPEEIASDFELKVPSTSYSAASEGQDLEIGYKLHNASTEHQMRVESRLYDSSTSKTAENALKTKEQTVPKGTQIVSSFYTTISPGTYDITSDIYVTTDNGEVLVGSVTSEAITVSEGEAPLSLFGQEGGWNGNTASLATANQTESPLSLMGNDAAAEAAGNTVVSSQNYPGGLAAFVTIDPFDAKEGEDITFGIRVLENDYNLSGFPDVAVGIRYGDGVKESTILNSGDVINNEYTHGFTHKYNSSGNYDIEIMTCISESIEGMGGGSAKEIIKELNINEYAQGLNPILEMICGAHKLNNFKVAKATAPPVLVDIVGQAEEPDHPAPTGVTISKAIMAGFENIAVYWTKPVPTMVTPGIEGYVISAKFKGANGQYIDTAEYESTESASATLHAVKGTSYFNNGATSVEAKVKAKYKDGTDSDWSNTATYAIVEAAAAPPEDVVQPPANHPAPTSLTVTEDTANVVISWQSPANPDLAISKYILQIEETDTAKQEKTYEEEIDPSITSMQVPKSTIEEGIETFEFLIRAKYSDNVMSTWSNKATYNAITQEIVIEEEKSEDPPEEEEEEVVQPTGNIKIKSADIWPKGFNPSLVLTKISFETTGTALIEVEITSSTGQKVVTLIDDEEAEADKYEIYWDGTDDPDESKGKVVPQGTYTWKVTAKDPTTKSIKDSESGTVNVVYNPGGADFESSTGAGNSSSITSTSATSTSTQSAQNTQNTLAMLSLQGATSGETAGTGPEMLVYLFLPAAGLLLRRKKR